MSRAKTPGERRRYDRKAAQAVLRRKALGVALDDLAELPVSVRARTMLALYEEVERGASRLDRRRQIAAKVGARKTAAIITRISPDAQAPPAPRRNAAYWALVGDPPICAPGEMWRARAFYDRLLTASESPEGEHWSRHDKAALRVMLWRWAKRANGEDARFNRYGNHPGRLTKEQEWTIALESIIWPVAYDDPSEPEKSLDVRAGEADTTPPPEGPVPHD